MSKFLNANFLGRFLTIFLFLLLSIAGLIFSIYLFSVSSNFYMYVLAISFTILSVVSGFFNIYASVWYFRSFFYDDYLAKVTEEAGKLESYPTVAVAMPTFNEDPDLIAKNMAELKKMNYPKDKIRFYLLDDSTKKEVSAKLVEAAKKHGFEYSHREDRTGFKAGNINGLVARANEEFLAIFDYDEFLTDKDFLLDTLPFFKDKKLAHIQTEKRYAKHSFFSDTVDIFDAFFFKFIEPARALNNTAVFCGSCGVVRMSVLKEMNGFPTFVIEDTFFSFESDMLGYKGLYLPKVYALGKPIKTFTELSSQQWRYNYGDTQFISYFLKKKNKKGSPMAKVDYITHGFGLNYLSVVVLLFTIVSIGLVFTYIPFAHINFYALTDASQLSLYIELLGLFAFTLSLLTPVFLTKIYFGSFSKGFMVFLLNYTLTFIRTKAAIASFLKGNPRKGWLRQTEDTVHNIRYALSNTKTEVVFSSVLFFAGAFALFNYNISGGIWMLWYAVLYGLTVVMFYKYG